jgi:hypothetical protein
VSIPNNRSTEQNEVEWYSLDDDHDRDLQNRFFSVPVSAAVPANFFPGKIPVFENDFVSEIE